MGYFKNLDLEIQQQQLKEAAQWREENLEVILQWATDENERDLVEYLEDEFEESPDGFYKFVNECKEAYAEKERSLDLIFGLSGEEVMEVFEGIGVIYPDEQSYLQAGIKRFGGKYYCCYYDSKSNSTWFLRNSEEIDLAVMYLAQSREYEAELEKEVAV
jgi:hypothetical protein